MAKYNHAFCIAFEVFSESDNPDDIDINHLYAALDKRIRNLKMEDDDVAIEAFDAYDVYQEQE